jgi:spermidine dehydrogenase
MDEWRMTSDDKSLGMGRRITRRDFLDGVAITIGGAIIAPPLLHAASMQSDTAYPPGLTGLRGSHVGSFEALHALRDETFWSTAPAVTPNDETYDLIVVGAGISGLTAAHTYLKSRPGSRILILDNHDDFGGHAKRNEFSWEGKTYLGYGGTQSIESPLPYSAVAKDLIRELGIDVSRYAAALDDALYPSLGLKSGFFFDRETFGADKLVVGGPYMLHPGFIAAAPISDTAKADLTRLVSGMVDPYPGLSSAARKARLARSSYARFLTEVWKVDAAVVAILQSTGHGLFGAGIDAIPAQDAHALGLPGFQGMALDDEPGPGQNYDSLGTAESDAYYSHFPDGNATIARLLVRKLIPEAIPGSTADDIITARADYGRLDRPDAKVRIRLSSPVLRVRHLGDPATATAAEVTYLKDGKLWSVTAPGVILACWHTGIPFLCPELPQAQKEAMAFEIKVPLVYTNVLLRNWTSFQKLGVHSVNAPGMWHTDFSLDFPVSIGAWHHARTPGEPIVVHMSKAACLPGLPIREQHAAGRRELYTTSFETIERHVRTDLQRVLGAGGFDAARDIVGLTVNRWPHGYAYQYNSLYDDFWVNGTESPCAVARRPYGRLAIANADAAAYAYTDAAIDHGHRAAQEILRLV